MFAWLDRRARPGAETIRNEPGAHGSDPLRGRVVEPELRPVGRAARLWPQPLRAHRRRDELRQLHRPARWQRAADRPVSARHRLVGQVHRGRPRRRTHARRGDRRLGRRNDPTTDGARSESVARGNAGEHRRHADRVDGDETPERARDLTP